MPNDKTDPRATDEDQAKAADPGSAASANQGPDPSLQLGADLDALLTENAEMRDRLLRTMADMENLRRRTELKGNEVLLSGDGDVPEEFRKLVEEYYKSLSKGGQGKK